jgi:hypothetical protein
MKECDGRPRIGNALKIATAAASAFLAGLNGLGCGGSGLMTGGRDAGALGGNAGGTGGAGAARGGASGIFILPDSGWATGGSGGGADGPCDASVSCNPGDIPVTSDTDCLNYPNSCYVNAKCGQVMTCRHGDGGSGARGDSGTAGTSNFPVFFPLCNSGDQQVASAVAPYAVNNQTDLSTQCPPGRQCYLQGDFFDGTILCMVPEGVHCNDSPACNPGDTQIPVVNLAPPSNLGPYYRVLLCNQSVLCVSSADASVFTTLCSGTYSDGRGLETLDGGQAPTSCCGDGHADPGEECDLSVLNGVTLNDWYQCDNYCRAHYPI